MRRRFVLSEWAKAIVLVVVSVFVALLVAEGVLRFIGYWSPSFYTVDVELGSALRPGAEGWWTKEGKAHVRINSDGLRDVEHVIQKPKGVFRVAILGDSYAEGLQLPIDKLFWKVLEGRLNGCLRNDVKVEVINFGVSGYGTGRELLMLRKKVWKYQPDVVVLAFLTRNDIRDNSKALNKVDYIPYFNLEKGELILDTSYKKTKTFENRNRWVTQLMYRYLNHVRLLQLANELRQTLRVRQETKAKQPTGHYTGPEAGLDNGVYLPPGTQTWKAAWAVTEALILQIRDEVRAHGARFLLVTLSDGVQVHPDPALRQAFMESVGTRDLFYPDRRIIDFARKNGIENLMLASRLQRWAEQHGTCVHGFANAAPCGGHWNEEGHQLAGEWIAEKICKDLVN